MNKQDRDSIIESHMAFIIKTASDLPGRYISKENDEEFSIALNAFDESIRKYDEKRGSFLSFARLVIENRLKNHLSGNDKNVMLLSLDRIVEKGFDVPDQKTYGSYEIHDEIMDFKQELEYFGLNLEKLADKAPKHKDTRVNAANAAVKASEDRETVDITYRRRRLPVRRVSRLVRLSEKVIRRSSSFIIACMIIIVKDFNALKEFITGMVG